MTMQLKLRPSNLSLSVKLSLLVGDGEMFFRPIGNRGFAERDFLGVALVAQDAGDDGRVQRVSGAVGLDVAQNALAEEGEVTDEVEDFVADELVGEAQRRIVDAVAREHN